MDTVRINRSHRTLEFRKVDISKDVGQGPQRTTLLCHVCHLILQFHAKLKLGGNDATTARTFKGFAFTFKGACATRYRGFAFKLKANQRHKLAWRTVGCHDVVPTPLRYHLQID